MPRLVRSLSAFLAAALLALQASLALAAPPQPWNEKAFRAAQAAGKPVLVDIHASW